MGTHPIFESDFDCLTDMGRHGFSVWMGGLPERVRSREIEDFFKGYGRILDVAIKSKYAFIEFEDERDADDAIRDLDDRRLNGSRVRLEKSKGCKDKYVDFQRTGRVRYRSYSREVSPGRRRYRSRSGGPSYRSRSRSRSPRRGSSRRENFYQKPAYKKYGAPEKTKWTVEVDNLSSRCSWQDLKDFMRKAGEVTYGDAHGDCGKNRGLVCFISKSDMERAVDELDGRKMNGTLGVVVPIPDHVRVLVPDVVLRLEGPAPAQLPGHDPVPDLDALVPLVAGDPDLDEMTRENF